MSSYNYCGNHSFKSSGGSSSVGYTDLFPLLSNAKWLELANYEDVTISVLGNVTTLNYIQAGNIIAKGIYTFVSATDWSFKLESYINDDDGDILLDDDNTPLFID